MLDRTEIVCCDEFRTCHIPLEIWLDEKGLLENKDTSFFAMSDFEFEEHMVKYEELLKIHKDEYLEHCNVLGCGWQYSIRRS